MEATRGYERTGVTSGPGSRETAQAVVVWEEVLVVAWTWGVRKEHERIRNLYLLR